GLVMRRPELKRSIMVSFPGSARERTAVEALPRFRQQTLWRARTAGRACPASHSQAEPGNERRNVEHRTLNIEHRMEGIYSMLKVRCCVFDVHSSKLELIENQPILPARATRLLGFVV